MGKRKTDQRKIVIAARQSNLWLAAFLGVLVLIAASGLSMVDGAQHMRDLYRDMGEVQREQDGLLAEHSRLLLERSARSNMQHTETQVQERLGMVFPETVGEVLQ